MATLTIRNLNDETREKLRLIAAQHGHSMEEEARRILRRAVAIMDSEAMQSQDGLGTKIQKIVANTGQYDMELPPRSLSRDLPDFSSDEY